MKAPVPRSAAIPIIGVTRAHIHIRRYGRTRHSAALARVWVMTTQDRTLQQGACACLELAARRGADSLEKALCGLLPRQRALVPDTLIDQLRREAAQREAFCKTV